MNHANLCNKVRRRRLQNRRESCSRRGKIGNAVKRAALRERLDRGPWQRVGTYLLAVEAAPDGRHMAIEVHGGDCQRYLCGSERAVRGALARLLWRQETTQMQRGGIRATVMSTQCASPSRA